MFKHSARRTRRREGAHSASGGVCGRAAPAGAGAGAGLDATRKARAAPATLIAPAAAAATVKSWVFDIRSRPFVLLAAAFGAATLLVMSGATAGADEAASSYLYGLAGNAAADLFMQSVTEAGDVFYMLGFAVALIILRPTRRIGITLMILLVLSTLVTGYVKCGVERERPPHEFAGNPFVLDLTGDTFSLFCAGGYNASYPSGHVGRAAVFAIVMAFVVSDRFPRGCYLILLYPALMAVSRVYLMEHYPSDVIASGILGALLAGALARKTRLGPAWPGRPRLRRRARPSGGAEPLGGGGAD